jgi:hypothetical protein
MWRSIDQRGGGASNKEKVRGREQKNKNQNKTKKPKAYFGMGTTACMVKGEAYFNWVKLTGDFFFAVCCCMNFNYPSRDLDVVGSIRAYGGAAGPV